MEQEVWELAEEASWLQSRAEGLQVTAHTADPAPEAAAAEAEDLDGEVEALAAKVEAVADPVETVDEPTARPATVAGTYRAMGGALLATADALDAVADLIQRKCVASQPQAPHGLPPEALHELPPEASDELPLETPPGEVAAQDEVEDMFGGAFEPEAEETPVSELESDLAAALGIGEYHDEEPKEDAEIPLELPEPSLDDEAPLPMSDAEPFLDTAEPAGDDVGRIANPSGDDADLFDGLPSHPTETPTPLDAPLPTAAEPAATEPAIPVESPAVDASPLLLKAVNLRSKAEALRARGQGLLTKADALTVAPGGPRAEFEAGEEGEEGAEGDYAFHGDWAAGGSAGQSAVAATAAGGTAMPFAITPRKQKKPKNAIREMVNVVLGGFTGLLLTYLVLNVVSDQYDFLGICPKWFPHIMKSESSTPTVPGKSSKVAKVAKPVSPGSPATPGSVEKSPAKLGKGGQVAKASPETQAADKADPLAGAELKSSPLDSSSGDAGPTTLAPIDTPPGAMASPSKPAEPESQPPPGDAKFGNVVDIAKPPAYGSEELGWALTNAQRAFQGDLKPESYAQLCRLAEVLTFVDPQKGVTGLPGQKVAVEKLLRDVGERDKHKNVRVVAQMADKWLDNPGREHPGILLAGRIQKIGVTGQGMTIAVIAMAKPDPKVSTERTIKMVSKEPLDLQVKDAVIVLGGLAVGGQGEVVVVHGMTVKFAVPPPKAK